MKNRRLLPRLTAALLSLSLIPMGAYALSTKQALLLLEQYHVDPIPPAALGAQTIEELLEAIGDPFTQYFTPEEYQDFLGTLSEGSLDGIGILYQQMDNCLLVTQVLEDSPAQNGGLEAGDRIIRIDGQEVAELTQEESANLLYGPHGSQVTLEWKRGDTIRSAVFQRDEIAVPSVYGTLLDGHIGYITCVTFTQNTAEYFRDLIQKYDSQADHWIIDLRGNPGGYVQAAADAAACFAGPGHVAFVRDRQGDYQSIDSTWERLTTSPVILLTDLRSASSSEIFAGSLRERGAGIVIGDRTFGKGTVQAILDADFYPDYFTDGDAMKISTLRHFTLSGNTIDQFGVLPDLRLKSVDTPAVACLLSGSAPQGDTSDYLRLDLGMECFIDLRSALTPELLPFLDELLSALPPHAVLWRGTGGHGWTAATPQQIARELGLTLHPHTFSDTAGNPYSTSIDTLAALQLISGDGSGAYFPEDSLTRAELCQLLAVACGCVTPKQSSPFTDVPENAWYKPAVTALTQMGLVNGVGEDRFDPDGLVDHQQFITILGRLAPWLNLSYQEASQEIPDSSLQDPDLQPFSPWARPHIWLMDGGLTDSHDSPISILWAPLDEIAPTAPTTRGEAAFALTELLIQIGVIHV